MARPKQEGMTQRESQIMEVIWKADQATVEKIRAALKDDLADSTIRTLLSIMRRKGYVDFHKQGKAKVFRALIPRGQAQTSALQHLIQRLFHGSADLLVARLVEDEQLSLEEIDRLRQALKRRQKEKG
jgi:predicted transcriptional regulator